MALTLALGLTACDSGGSSGSSAAESSSAASTPVDAGLPGTGSATGSSGDSDPASASSAEAVAALQKPTVGKRAMWVWGAPSSQSLISFAKAHGVSDLFVEVTTSVATDGNLPRLKQLKRLADAASIHLYALNGDPAWAIDQTAALTWQSAALSTGLFAGIHLDVEPYSLPQWQTAQAQTAQSYLKLLGLLKASSSLPVEVDVPFWYGTIAAPPGSTGATLADAVLAVVDEVTVMSYRNTATGINSIIDVGTDMLTRAAAARKPLRLGAETNPTADCANCSFAGISAANFNTAINAVNGGAAIFGGYAGIAIEDYTGWSQLR